MKPNRRIKRALMGDFALDNWHEHRVDREAFTVYVGGDPHLEGDDVDGRGIEPGVEHHMADRLELNLHILTAIDPKRPILIISATCGGEWEAGMQMFGAILSCPNPVTVLAIKHARSMSSIFPLAADRFLLRPPTQYMYHYGTSLYEGNSGEQEWTNHEQGKIATDTMLRLYVARLKERGLYARKHPSWIRSLLEDKMRRKVDVFLSSDDAVHWGFADAVCLGTPDRAMKRNVKRRNAMMAVIRRPR